MLSVPVIVMVYVPAAVVLLVMNIRVEDDPAFTGLVLKVAVIPLGIPVAERVGEPV